MAAYLLRDWNIVKDLSSTHNNFIIYLNSSSDPAFDVEVVEDDKLIYDLHERYSKGSRVQQKSGIEMGNTTVTAATNTRSKTRTQNNYPSSLFVNRKYQS